VIEGFMVAVLLRVVVIGGLLGSLLVTALGLFADRWPYLELLNHFRPAFVIGAVALAGLALVTRRRPLIAVAALVAAINIALFGFALKGVAAAPTGGSERFIRVLTYNMWLYNRKLGDIAQFINSADADFAVLQEVPPWYRDRLHALIKERYPYFVGDSDVVIFTRHRALESEQLNNIFASPEFSAISVETGPPIGSDHRPLVADIALEHSAITTRRITRAANYP
jgi:endonuclease/exonuclease/phosphatase (EEP) superfamily protein YafD